MEWPTVSASQVETFIKCERAWYNGSILKDRAPQTASQTRGVEVHAELEHYGKTGEVRPSTYLEIVQACLPALGEHPHIKDPYWEQFAGKAGLLLEQPIEMATYEGGPLWNGFIDRVVAMPDSGEVWDYKTTSDFRYAKTPEELKHGPQMISYAKWLFLQSDYPQVLIKHLVIRMRGRAMVKPVEAILTREECETEWVKVLGTVRKMQEWTRLGPKTADALPPNTEHCSAYGGCYYRQKCGFTNCDKAQRSFGMSDNDLLQKMLANATSAGVAAPAPLLPGLVPAPAAQASPASILANLVLAPAAPAAQAAAPTPIAQAAPPSILASLMGTAAPAPAAAPTPTPAPAAAPTPTPTPVTAPPSLLSLLGQTPPANVQTPQVSPQAAALPAMAPAPTVVPTGILPPDAASRISTPAEVGPAPVVSAPVLAAPEPAPSPEVTVVAPTTAPVDPAAALTERPKRGRPRKSAAAPVETVVVTPGDAVSAQTVVDPKSFAAGIAAVLPTAPAPAAVFEASAPSPSSVESVLAPFQVAAEAVIAAPQPAPTPSAPPTDGTAKLLDADSVFKCGCETLFIDTIPQKGWPGEQPVWLDSLMAAFTRLAAVSAKQPDIAMIRYEAKGYLRTAIRVLMCHLPKTIVVTTSTAGAAEFLEVVTPYAQLVFRGIR